MNTPETFPTPHSPEIVATPRPTPKQERQHKRIQGNIQALAVQAARERVPNVEAPEHLTRQGARDHLRQARAEYSGKNRFFNRATRRSLAREVKLA